MVSKTSVDQSRARRLTGAILLAFLVFLPLHYHAFTPTSQLAKECPCIYGSRTEAGLVPVTGQWTPLVEFVLIQIIQPQFISQFVSRLHAIRAPPTL